MSTIQNLCDSGDIFGKLSVRRFIYPEKPFPIPVELRAAGMHYISSHEYSWDGMQRSGMDTEALLQYTLSGSGALEWNGETLPVPPGSAMLLTFPEKHRYFLPEDSDHWEVLYVSFGGPGAVEIIRSLREQSGPVIALSPTGKTVSTMRSFRHTDPPSSAWAAADMGYHLLMLLADELACRLQGENRSFLKPVLDYCRNHLNGDLSVDALAEISGYSRWHFSRAFKKIQGVSVPQYVLELRLKQAEELLQFTQYSIKEIAEMCGFRNTAYFIRCFSNTFGVTPGIFRKQT